MMNRKFISLLIGAVLFTQFSFVGPLPAEDENPVKKGYVPVHGLKIYCEVYGVLNETTVPLVLLHGGGSTLDTSFGSIIPRLAKNRTVIAFDQKGHGRTADNIDPFSFEDSADDTVALLLYFKVRQADFLGYSNGGNIALQIAIRHQKVVRKLIIASAMTKRDGMVEGFWEGMKNAKLDSMPAELKEAYLKNAPDPKQLQSFHDKSVARMMEFTDWPDSYLKGIQVPTLILIGDHDIIRPEHAMEMFRLLPKGELLIVPGVNHMTLVQNWPVALINKFLDAAENPVLPPPEPEVKSVLPPPRAGE